MLSLDFSSCFWLCSPSAPQQAIFLTLPRSHLVLTFVFIQARGSAFCPLVLVEVSGLAKVGGGSIPSVLSGTTTTFTCSPLCGPVSKSRKHLWRGVPAQHDAGVLTRGSFSPFLVNPSASQP